MGGLAQKIEMAAHKQTSIVSVDNWLPVCQGSVVKLYIMYFLIEFYYREINCASSSVTWLCTDIDRKQFSFV